MSQPLSEAATARLDAFHALLDCDPQDWLTRSLLADWDAEQGDTAAEDCLRWQVRERKRPGYGSPRQLEHYRWYDLAEYMDEEDPESDLPQPLFRCLKELRYTVSADDPVGEPQ